VGGSVFHFEPSFLNSRVFASFIAENQAFVNAFREKRKNLARTFGKFRLER
jgi:hypothetical protein